MAPSDKEKLLDYVEKSDSVQERIEICKAYLKKFDTQPKLEFKVKPRYDELEELKFNLELQNIYYSSDPVYKEKFADDQAVKAFAEKLLPYMSKKKEKDYYTDTTMYTYGIKILKNPETISRLDIV
jgi:hypothetical protein